MWHAREASQISMTAVTVAGENMTVPTAVMLVYSALLFVWLMVELTMVV